MASEDLPPPISPTPVSSEVLQRIAGRERLIDHLGSWPDFDDFEVLSLTLERPLGLTAASCLRATFFIFDLGKDPADPERRQGTAELLFEDLGELTIENFTPQNPICLFSIEADPAPDALFPFRVAWGGCGHEVEFRCSRISVTRVVDLNPFRKSFVDRF